MKVMKPGLLKAVECINIMLSIGIAGGFAYINLVIDETVSFDRVNITEFSILTIILVHSLFNLWITQTKYPDKEITNQQLSIHYLFFGLTILALLMIGFTCSVLGYTLWEGIGNLTLKGYILAGIIILSSILILLKSLSCFLSYRLVSYILKMHRYDI